MSISYRHLCIEKYKYLCDGLTFEDRDLRVLDGLLESFDKETGLVTYIADCNDRYGYEYNLDISGPQYIIIVDKFLSKERELALSSIGQKLDAIDLPPAVHLNLQSPTMNIPQRVEIPLRYLVKGGPSLDGTFMVYLHALEINDKETFSYYGVTKRGWMKRFIEHLKLGVKKRSHRRFSKMLGDGVRGRYSKLGVGRQQKELEAKQLTGSYHVVCAAGRSRTNAYQIENYLIQKRSIASPLGLNMIRGHRDKE